MSGILSGMFWKRFGSDATSIEGPLRIPPELGYSPYGEAWKEYDKLDRVVHNRGPLRWIRGVFDALVLSGVAFGFKTWKQDRPWIVFAWAAVVGLEMVHAHIMKERFKHWQCPRCHREWTGTSKEKDSACTGCGLRLHQLTP
ncbi:MAG: hypothetical protein ACHQJX_07070 [Candidatus Acidiferrales bacterium]|nr:hypothetical protein [Candidatus Acidoferrales bacterium]